MRSRRPLEAAASKQKEQGGQNQPKNLSWIYCFPYNLIFNTLFTLKVYWKKLGLNLRYYSDFVIQNLFWGNSELNTTTVLSAVAIQMLATNSYAPNAITKFGIFFSMFCENIVLVC